MKKIDLEIIMTVFKMKKVLIIFPKLKAVTSRIRLQGIIKFIDNDWKPVILTNGEVFEEEREFDVIKVPYDEDFISNKWKNYLGLNLNETVSQNLEIKNKRTKEKIINKLIYYWQEIFLYPDEFRKWRKAAVQAASNYIEKNNVDAIISSFPPVTPHIIANDLKNKYDLPWIADMRDLWTDYHYYRYGFLRKHIEKKLEIKTLSAADYITTVSGPFADALRQTLKDREITVIENGFDPDEVNNKMELSPKFSITYTGQLYDGKRDPILLFKALSELKSEEKIDIHDFEINFYGDAEEWLREEIQEYRLENIVKLHGLVKRETSLENQRKSQLLLLLRWNNPDEMGVIPGKIFEYLAAKRYILSIGCQGGIIEELLENTKAGTNLVVLDDIKEQIKNLYQEFKLNGKIEYKGIEQEVNKYNHREMARKFADIFDKLN